MATPNGSAQTPAVPAVAPEKNPLERWAERHLKNGGDSEELIAALRFVDELKCIDAIAETVAPKLFGLDAKLSLRESLAEAKGTLETLDISDLDGHARVVDAAESSPIGNWLLALDGQRRSATNPRLQHLLALEAAAARGVLADLRCAQSAGRTVFPGEKLTAAQAIRLLDGLCETKDRLASLAEQHSGDAATPV